MGAAHKEHTGELRSYLKEQKLIADKFSQETGPDIGVDAMTQNHFFQSRFKDLNVYKLIGELAEFDNELEKPSKMSGRNGVKDDAVRHRMTLVELFRRQCLDATQFRQAGSLPSLGDRWTAFLINTFNDSFFDNFDKSCSQVYIAHKDSKQVRHWYCLHPLCDEPKLIGNDLDMKAALKKHLRKKNTAVFRITEPPISAQFWKCPGHGNALQGSRFPCGKVHHISVKCCGGGNRPDFSHKNNYHEPVTQRPWFRVPNLPRDRERRRRAADPSIMTRQEARQGYFTGIN